MSTLCLRALSICLSLTRSRLDPTFLLFFFLLVCRLFGDDRLLQPAPQHAERPMATANTTTSLAPASQQQHHHRQTTSKQGEQWNKPAFLLLVSRPSASIIVTYICDMVTFTVIWLLFCETMPTISIKREHVMKMGRQKLAL